jgi:geranylgeranyl pyrophosphate synthase
MTQLPLSDATRTDLQAVDVVVRERLRSQRGVVRVLGPQATGGDRLRAALTLLSARLGNYNLEQVIHAASAVELIYGATTVHNRLIDLADQQRRTDETNWNDAVPLMIGDYLFALSAGEMALSPDPRVITFFARAVQRICEGELSPVLAMAPLATARDQYMAYIADTAGALCAASCEAGMTSGGGTPAQIEALGRFGMALGSATQIAADVHDYARPGSPAAPVGESLRRGAITLPLIYAAAAAPNAFTTALSALGDDEEQIGRIVALVRKHGLAPALQDARALADEALGHITPFSGTPAHAELVALVGALV